MSGSIPGTMRIMIIEDDIGIAELIQDLLQNSSNEITTAYSGKEAISMLSKELVDLLIVDYSLPDMTAKDLILQLQKCSQPLPSFIISTGQGDEHIAVEMMKLGAQDYLVKDSALLNRLPGVVDRTLNDIRRKEELKQALEAQRKSEEKLKEEQRRLVNIIKATKVGTWEWNLHTGEIFINERWAEIIGYRLDELSPLTVKTWRKLVMPEDLKATDDLMEKHLNGQINFMEQEFRIKHKKGQWVWVLANGCIIDIKGDGKPLLMAGTMQDITEKKQQKNLEKEIEVAKQSVRFKQNFLANMSHEIRTPLTGVLGMIELLDQTPVSKKQKDYLNTLKSSTENLREIINQVLDFSKIEAGKLTLKYRKFKFQNLLVNAQKLFSCICSKDIVFNIVVDSQMPTCLLADEGRIAQIVNNLISNAVKFTEKGEIGLKAFPVPGDTQLDDLLIRIEITDTGLGITPESQKKLFIPFSQVGDNDTRLFEGTGLGLSICKELVALHGGEIGVESTPNKGSKFWFTFKAGLVKGNIVEDFPCDDDLDREMKQGLRILLVEDKEVTQKVVKLLLSNLGHEVSIANHGKQALEIFSPDLFDVIFMDIQMPVMDGITATRILRKKYTGLPPIVGLSANAFEGDREKYIQLGMDEYLTKPVKGDELKNLLNKLFSNS